MIQVSKPMFSSMAISIMALFYLFKEFFNAKIALLCYNRFPVIFNHK